MAVETFLRGFVVVRDREQEPIDTETLGLL